MLQIKHTILLLSYLLSVNCWRLVKYVTAKRALFRLGRILYVYKYEKNVNYESLPATDFWYTSPAIAQGMFLLHTSCLQ